MKMKQKKDYCPPVTKMAQVQLEGVICASADITNPNQENGRIKEHEVNTDFGYNFTDQGWDNNNQ